MLKVPLRKPLLGLRVELGDLFLQQPPSDLSEQLENLSKQPEYKVGRIRIGGGGDSLEQTSQAAHFLLSHHFLSSLLAAHSRNGIVIFIILFCLLSPLVQWYCKFYNQGKVFLVLTWKWTCSALDARLCSMTCRCQLLTFNFKIK